MNRHPGKSARNVFVSLGLAAMTFGCVSQNKYREALNTAEHYKKAYEGLHQWQTELDSRNRDLEAQVASANVKGAQGLAAYEEATALREEYQRRVRALEAGFGGSEGFSSGDVEIFSTAEGEVYRIKDAILFDSGSSTIKSAGKKLIQEIATQIKSDGRRIRVEGHTDSDPVVRAKERFPYGNLQLSSARAMEVANLLIQDGKVPANLISVTGYGEYRPIGPNDTTANKRRNRRVEIVVTGQPATANKTTGESGK